MARDTATRNDGFQGPGWWDCEDVCKRLEKTFGVKPFIAVRCEPATGYRNRPFWVVTAGVPKGHSLDWEKPIGQAVMGGNTGHKTFPTAMYWALAHLYANLEQRETDAREQARF